MADAIKIIKSDHREVEKLFKEFEGTGDRALAKRKALADEVCDKLTLHAKMEESCFYPRLGDKFKKEGVKLVEEAYAEHEVVKDLIIKIGGLSPDDPQFTAKVMVLKEMVAHHVKEEEKEMLPKMKKELPKKTLEEMGMEMEAFRGKRVAL